MVDEFSGLRHAKDTQGIVQGATTGINARENLLF